MQYRDFGKLGIKVSALGFGAMRLPEDQEEAIKVIRRAI
ncbi:MAG: aldo/keto reductase, partial [Bacillota bacterium]